MIVQPYVRLTLWTSDLMIVRPYECLILWLSDTPVCYFATWNLMIVRPYDRPTLWSSDLMIVRTYDCPVKMKNLWSDLMIVRWKCRTYDLTLWSSCWWSSCWWLSANPDNFTNQIFVLSICILDKQLVWKQTDPVQKEHHQGAGRGEYVCSKGSSSRRRKWLTRSRALSRWGVGRTDSWLPRIPWIPRLLRNSMCFSERLEVWIATAVECISPVSENLLASFNSTSPSMIAPSFWRHSLKFWGHSGSWSLKKQFSRPLKTPRKLLGSLTLRKLAGYTQPLRVP